MSAPERIWISKYCGEIRSLPPENAKASQYYQYVRAYLCTSTDERARALEAENARLREYYDAVEAVDASGYSAAAIERINRARAALRDMEGGK